MGGTHNGVAPSEAGHSPSRQYRAENYTLAIHPSSTHQCNTWHPSNNAERGTDSAFPALDPARNMRK